MNSQWNPKPIKGNLVMAPQPARDRVAWAKIGAWHIYETWTHNLCAQIIVPDMAFLFREDYPSPSSVGLD